MYKYLSILIIFLMSCEISNQEKITDEEVKEKFHEFFDILSVKNPDKNKLYGLVTDDYYIFENKRKYTMKEFIEFINSFKTIEDNWVLSDFKIYTDINSAHVTLKNKGKFLVETDSGKVTMNFEWLESAYLIKENNELKLNFYFSEVIKESVIKVD